MKDLQKIKEFFLSNRAATTAYESKSPMSEALMLDKYEVDFFHTKANVYANIEIPSENPTFEDNIQIKGIGKTEEEAFKDLKQNYENYKKTGIHETKSEDKVDTITMDIPLFIRMLEYSREDAAADVDLHDVTEKAVSLNKEKGILSMEDYDSIVGAAEDIKENKLKNIISKVLSEKKSVPCWKGYEQVGMKEKNGKQVPNCVPKK